jgi:hypothetical protein
MVQHSQRGGVDECTLPLRWIETLGLILQWQRMMMTMMTMMMMMMMMLLMMLMQIDMNHWNRKVQVVTVYSDCWARAQHCVRVTGPGCRGYGRKQHSRHF